MDYTKLKGDKFGLLKVLVRTLWVQLLLPIPPRAALIAFYSCQPLFIESLVTYLSHSDPDPNVGYGLIGAAIIIYSGIGISYALYWYCHHRLRTMVRSILVTETFKAATRVRLGAGILINFTATVIASMKWHKISGLAGPVAAIMIFAAVFAFMPQLISPPLTFAFAQNPLNAST
ncbi:hypothetical protein KXV85_008494, partial [Aspergillus fumigatus]